MTFDVAEYKHSAARRETVRKNNAKRTSRPGYAEYHAAYNLEWRKNNPLAAVNWAVRHLPFVKYRAEKKGIVFDISPQDIVIPAVCPVFGRPFVYGVKGHTDSPSLDRIRPALGYVKGNVAVISRRANTIKSDATAEELLAVAAWAESAA